MSYRRERSRGSDKPGRKGSLDLPRDRQRQAQAARVRALQAADDPQEQELCPEAVQVRRLLLERAGRISRREIADTLGLPMATVSRSLLEIRRVSPLPRPEQFEEREVCGALAFWDEVEAMIAHDIEENQALAEHWSANPIVTSILNARIGLINQLQLARTNRTKFLQDVGLLRRVAQEVNVSVRNLANLTDDALDAEIVEIDRKLKELETRGAEAELDATGDRLAEAPEVHRDAEGEDHLSRE